MLREENFIAFWTVFGFFVGLMVGFTAWNDPFVILAAVGAITFFFYLFAHVSVAMFVRFMEFGKVHFDKEEYEYKLDFFYNQLLKREVGVHRELAETEKENEPKESKAA